MNYIIFGGGFDPIHLGHLNMAKQASTFLDAEVIFVPARISVWKNKSIEASKKVEMIKLSIKDEPRFRIDLFELNSGKDVNYSIDTIRYFKNKYRHDKLYYLIGSDQVNSFHLWKEAENIASSVQLVYFARPGYELDENNIKKYHMLEIKGEVVDVSSSDIRELKSLMIPLEVLRYIEDNRLYFINKINEYIDEYRLNHSISVARLAYDIALKHQLKNPEKVYTAAILHDVGKEYKDSKAIMEQYFEEYKDMPAFSYHQFVGAYLAKTVFGIEDETILNAIKFHATGNENMDEVSMIVYAADKIDPSRDYDSTELITAMMDNDIEKGFRIVLKANQEFLDEQGKMTDNPLTSKCFKQYLV